MNTTIKAQKPNPYKIRCKDCEYRDRTFIAVKGNGAVAKVINCGVTRATCEKFKPPEYISKPHEVLFDNADCEFYKKENK